MRLAGGRVENEGRVEICVNRRWSTICSNSFWGFHWDSEEARVTCRQLGFSRMQPNMFLISLFPPIFFADSVPRPQYGGGSGLIKTYSCNGDEDYLWKCNSNQGSFNLILCNHDDDAGVLCLEG